ncbi:MAG: phosphate acyltransferase PlsX [Acidobacteriota bacterium]
MLKIAVDAMGGDYAPASEVEGAIQAVRELDASVILVGQIEKIQSELAKHRAAQDAVWDESKIEIVDAREVITMNDPVAQAFRRKRDSSIRVAATLVQEGKAHALVSAGNTGAVMMTAKLIIGSLSKVDRPALATVLPTYDRAGAVLLDVGANAECKPKHLYEFAVMGSLYSSAILGVENPRVGVLSIGEEEEKGNDLTKEAAKLLKDSRLNFIGNVEGRDLYNNQADVIVCDGFTGNVALKVSEGVVEFIMSFFKKAMAASEANAAMASNPVFASLRKRLDYSEYGGAPLLGIKSATVICHGRSNAKAIRNAIAVARDYSVGKVSERIEEQLTT